MACGRGVPGTLGHLAWYLVDSVPTGGTFVLDGPEGRHAATVRRTRVGEQVVLTDGAGEVASAAVTGVDRSSLTVSVQLVLSVPAAAVLVTVVQALPKGERSDLAVDLLTEAGADAIVPWQAARCVARWNGDKADKGVQKWRTVAEQAAKQARRPFVPRIAELAGLSSVERLVGDADLALLLHEATDDASFAGISWPTSGRIVLVVGPEGGLSPDEVSRLTAAGGRAVRLGPEVLRTSAAGAVALGALAIPTGRWT